MASCRIYKILRLLNQRPACNRLCGYSDGLRKYQSSTINSNQTESDALSLNPFDSVDKSKSNFINELNLPIKKSFNLAAYVNHSETLQELIKLGVSLYDIENTNREAAQYYVTLDFKRDCVEHIKFLVDNGLKEKNLGIFISEFPLVFKEHIDDLQARLNYLESKGFTKRQIASALNKSSFLLSQSTKTTDFKLGHLQIQFNLPAKILRNMVSLRPQIIAIPEDQYKVVNFTLDKEFGFTLREIHSILEAQPSILEMHRSKLIERIDFVHNIMELSHPMIAKFPKLLTGPFIEIRQRFEYLKKLKRNQFNPKLPLYVPPKALYNIDDETFCEKYAKTNVHDYNLFIKSQ